MRGVRGVFNHIEIRPKVTPRDVQKRIIEALHRHADVDARRISVTTEAGLVVLNGTVRSCRERDDVLGAAWAAPGVRAVEDRLKIVP